MSVYADLSGREVEIPVLASAQQSHFQNIVSFPNGTLYIARLSSHDGKRTTFICEAANGIGSGISKLVHVKVNGKFSLSLSSFL